MFSLRGIYSPIQIPPTLFLAMGKPHQTAWKKTQEAQQRWQNACDVLPSLIADADQAPLRDEADALAAVRDGKPIPAPTAEAAAAAVVAKRREIDSLAVIADELEQTFLAGLKADRDVLASDARAMAEEFGQRAAEQIGTVLDTLDVLADLLGLWRWARDEDATGIPDRSRMVVRFNGQDHSAAELIEAAAGLLAKVLPTGVEKAEADMAAYNATLAKDRYTGDGLLVDRAAQNAYRS